MAQQFDCLTGENEFKPRSLQPQPGKFNFAAADRIIEFARQHDMKVVGHTLCRHSEVPAWMFRGPDGKPLPREETVRNLKAHIDAVVGHFKGKVIGWDVVNEAISEARTSICAIHRPAGRSATPISPRRSSSRTRRTPPPSGTDR